MQYVNANGDFFLNADGTESHYVGLSDFALAKRWWFYQPLGMGPEELVRPIFVERRGIADRAGYSGPLVFRVFKYGHPNNAFGAPPDGYDKKVVLDGLAKLAAEYNSYIDFTTGDSQHVLPNQNDQQRHLNESEAAMSVFHYVETCNEPFKNGIDVSVVKPAKTPLNCRDSGAYGDIGNPNGGWPMDTILDYVSYHGTREGHPGNRFPKWVMDLDDQIGVIRTSLGKAPVLKEPIGFEKNEIPGKRYNDPFLARLLGQRASMGGVCFHSTLGLSSDGFDDETKTAFGEYCRGVAGALR